MARVAYTVTASLPDTPTRDLYEAWLLGGHVEQVRAGGAETAQVVRLSEPPMAVQTRYEFASEAAFERYLRDHAPALRADGLARFGSLSGVSFRREVGTILQ
jgi:hypothetical protein